MTKWCKIRPIFTHFVSMDWFSSGACGRARTIGAIMHGQTQMNFRKPIKESHDF